MLAFVPDVFPKQRVKWCRFPKIAGQLGNIISVGKLWVMGGRAFQILLHLKSDAWFHTCQQPVFTGGWCRVVKQRQKKPVVEFAWHSIFSLLPLCSLSLCLSWEHFEISEHNLVLLLTKMAQVFNSKFQILQAEHLCLHLECIVETMLIFFFV